MDEVSIFKKGREAKAMNSPAEEIDRKFFAVCQ
jgi:hypothetical protein